MLPPSCIVGYLSAGIFRHRDSEAQRTTNNENLDNDKKLKYGRETENDKN